MLLFRLTIFLPFLFYLNVCISQQVIYVNNTATGQNTGLSWQDAFIDLKDALNQSSPGDSVWVAKGIYYPTFTENQAIFFELKSGVTLLGGFLGNEFSSLNRDWELHSTILDGNIGLPGDSTDNSYTLVYSENPDSLTVLDGFILRNGSANANMGSFSGQENNGGAIYVRASNGGDAFLNVSNCVFLNNSAVGNGGAVAIYGSNLESVSPIFKNCVFEKNKAERSGGAIFKVGGSYIERNPDYYFCTFKRNSSELNGGAITESNDSGIDELVFSDCLFLENNSSSSSAIRVLCGRNSGSSVSFLNSSFEENFDASEVVYCLNFVSNVKQYTVTNCEFIKNEGFINLNGTVFGNNSTDINIANCVIKDNDNCVLQIDSEKHDLNVKNLTFINNSGKINLNSKEGNSWIANNTFKENEDFSIEVNNAPNLNNLKNDSVFLIQNRFLKNHITYRELISTKALLSLFSNNIWHKNIVDSIFTQGANEGFSLYQNCIFTDFGSYFGSTSNTDSTLLENCYMDILNCDSLPLNIDCGASNISEVDPLFLDAINHNFRLHPCSPLINSGTNEPIQTLSINTDVDNNSRILDGVVDIGVYESNYSIVTSSLPQITAACSGIAEGAVQIVAEGGGPPYTINWIRSDDGSTGSDTTMLLKGDYLFTITDAMGRKLELPLIINGSSPELSFSGDSTACAFIANGFVESQVVNAEQPVDYLWNTSENTPNLQNLQQGVYTLSISDAFGCNDTASFEVTATPPVIASVDIQEATGVMNADGAIYFEVTNGFPPYEYIWSNGATTDSISGLIAGNYRVTVEDANGCAYVFVYDVSWSVSSNQLNEVVSPNNVYPNPVSAGQPTSLHFSDANQWRLMDAEGKVLVNLSLKQKATQNRALEIELPCKDSGAYFWAFYKNSKIIETGKLIIE